MVRRKQGEIWFSSEDNKKNPESVVALDWPFGSALFFITKIYLSAPCPTFLAQVPHTFHSLSETYEESGGTERNTLAWQRVHQGSGGRGIGLLPVTQTLLF